MQTNVHAAGAWHLIKSTSAVRVGGVWKPLSQIWARTGGAWKQVYAASFSGTLHSGGAGPPEGYLSGSYGTLTPSVDPLGNTISQIADIQPGTAQFVIAISGFSGDPLQTYFNTLTINSVTNYTSASAVSYSYNAGTGTAQWQYNGHYGFLVNTDYTITITYS